MFEADMNPKASGWQHQNTKIDFYMFRLRVK